MTFRPHTGWAAVLAAAAIAAAYPTLAVATTEHFFDNDTLGARSGFASTSAHNIYFIESQADHNNMCVQPVTGVAGATGFLSIGSRGACSPAGGGGYVFTSFPAYGFVHGWLGNANTSLSVYVSYTDFAY